MIHNKFEVSFTSGIALIKAHRQTCRSAVVETGSHNMHELRGSLPLRGVWIRTNTSATTVFLLPFLLSRVACVCVCARVLVDGFTPVTLPLYVFSICKKTPPSLFSIKCSPNSTSTERRSPETNWTEALSSRAHFNETRNRRRLSWSFREEEKRQA